MKPPIVITVFATCALAIVPVNFGQDMFATERAQDDASLALALQINAQSQIEARIAELQRQTELLQHQRETPERPKSTAELEGAERKPAVDRFNAENKFSYQPRITSYNFATPTPAADQIAQLQEQIETLQKQLELQKQQVEQQIEQQRQAQFARAVQESKAEVVRLYPDAGVTGSVFSNKMIEIADRLEKQGNPLVYEADSPLKVARLAAKELGIQPR